MDGEMKYKSYYKECLEKGLEYQDFVTSLLLKEVGIPLSSLSSKKYQYSVGENLQGIEIKFDDLYKDTGNLYIEVKEKADPKNIKYVGSGIYRSDNSWIYLIGDYHEVYIFGKSHLKLMYDSGKYREVKKPTSVGFLIPKKDAEKYCLKKIDI